MFSKSAKSNGKRSSAAAGTAGRKKSAKPAAKHKSAIPLTATNKISRQIETTKGKGAPIEGNSKSFMESRLGKTFDQVNIHTDGASAQMSDDLQAKAFTSGNDIYFNKGQYHPESADGRRLLAHELAHVQQQRKEIRRAPMPTDARGRPLGFVPTPEQEAYDQQTQDIREWNKTLDRLKSGELDDRDMSNSRLMDRLAGLVEKDLNDLVVKIKAYQKAKPTVVTKKLQEWLEVRTQISTPMPAGAAVSRDPLTQTIDSYSVTFNGITVKVLADTFGNAGNDTAPTTDFPKKVWIDSNSSGMVTGFFDVTGGGKRPIDPKSISITIITKYSGTPDSTSSYGRGTTQDDLAEHNTTLRFHEGSHGTGYLNYIRDHPFPVDLSKGVVGVLTEKQLQSVYTYINEIARDTCEMVDEVGTSQESFLKTTAGKSSGVKNCRKP